MRKVLYLSLKEFRTAQKRQLDGDCATNSNGGFEFSYLLTLVLNPLEFDIFLETTIICCPFVLWHKKTTGLCIFFRFIFYCSSRIKMKNFEGG